MTSDSVGLRSRGHLDRSAASDWRCSGERGSPLAANQRRKAGRLSVRKCSGRWWALLAVLIDQAGRPESSNRGCRGPPPSVVRLHLSGSSLRGVAPWPLQ
eukprot:3335261-Pleurochrysis_carterae.AAC.1